MLDVTLDRDFSYIWGQLNLKKFCRILLTAVPDRHKCTIFNHFFTAVFVCLLVLYSFWDVNDNIYTLQYFIITVTKATIIISSNTSNISIADIILVAVHFSSFVSVSLSS